MKNILFISFKIFLKNTKTSLWSLLGIIIGISVLFLSFSLMDGYKDVLDKALKKIYPPLLIKSESQFEPPKYIKDYASIEREVFIEGLIYGRKEKLSKFVYCRAKEGQEEVLFGKTLANKLNLREGDLVIFVYKEMGSLKNIIFKIDTIKSFGISFVDESYIIIPLKMLKNLPNSYGVYPKDKISMKKLKSLLEKEILWDQLTFEEITKDLFLPLKTVEWSIGFVLSLITFVATFQLISRLLLDMKEKKVSFATLYALGMNRSQIIFSFSIYSFLLGFFGIVLGIFFGYFLSVITNSLHLLSFGELLKEAYFVSEIILKPSFDSIVIILFLGVFLNIFVSIFTFFILKRINIVDALRFE